ncbi:MAG: oligopeptide transporter, OPT family [Candidatus Delongbacteria bacterium]
MTEPQAPSVHSPYVPAGRIVPELGLLPLLLGVLLGIIFGAASLYLALRIGMTISASIPIAVMSISIFRWFSRAFGSRPASILENNMVQTTGSAGESIAFGVAVTMPALLVLGYDMDLWRIMTVAVLGGLLGILLMIPLRRGLIVKEHGKLAYPEGTACAEVLIVGEQGGTNARTVFTGFGLGFLGKLLAGDGGLRVFKTVPERLLGFFKGGSLGLEHAPELLGVGYIIGPRIAGIMCAGGVLAYLVLIPAIKIFGEGLGAPLFPAQDLIREMDPHQIRNAYVLYIGAGAVATGGILSMLKVLPLLAAAFGAGMKDLLAGRGQAKAQSERTDRDLPLGVVGLGSLALVGALMLAPGLHVSALGAVLVVVFGFLFVTVSSRLTGEIGSSSNPISGMTVATLLLTCLLYLALGLTSPLDRVAALMVAAIVCVASSNGGTTSQDLKTGYLIGATPRAQQIGILVGALTSAIVIGLTLKLFNDSATVYAKRDLPWKAPVELLGKTEGLRGPDAARDAALYRAVFITDETAPKDSTGRYLVPPGKYLAEADGTLRYLVDPGINGVVDRRDPAPGESQGVFVRKFDAPKARLMSLIIDGILTHKLPWGLVLLGVFIALTLELAGISSLPFAVGVYLPLSASTPIWVGGLVRWWVERGRPKPVSESEGDSSPGVLLSSGLIAGGAIAGMTLAIIAGTSEAVSARLGTVGDALGWNGSDLASLAAFGVLALVLYWIAKRPAVR